MLERIKRCKQEIESIIISDSTSAENFRLEFLSKKGKVSMLFDEFKQLNTDEKRLYGAELNLLKKFGEEKFNAGFHKSDSANFVNSGIDFSRSSGYILPGTMHPLNIVKSEVIDVFKKIGFSIAEGPEIEDDWHNFSALNIPENHPARDMQDTFFVNENPNIVLRTHTSPVQIRSMIKHQPPLRIIMPGRVYRCDSDATHSPIFHQNEGLYIDKDVSFADLKQVLFHFVQEIFGTGVKIRFRPSFFPFTEPSAEMDIEWDRNGKKSWMEILGCGMVDPNVMINCNINPDEFTGYAFGLGIERITMLKYGISDIRLFLENDIRFLEQFRVV